MSKLLQMLVANANNKSSQLKIVAEADKREATAYVYGAIGGWYDVDPEAFVREIAALDVDVIHLRINTPGGEVFGARAMANALRGHKARVIAYIDGLSASAGSFLMLCADEIEIAEGAFVMIHRASGGLWGTAADHRAEADLLDKLDESQIDSFMAKAGGEREQWRARIDAETWFNADEAIAIGLVDRKAGSGDAAKASWNLTGYANVPKALLEPVEPEPDIDAQAKALHAQAERTLAFLEKIAP